jgi:hypothetical protein
VKTTLPVYLTSLARTVVEQTHYDMDWPPVLHMGPIGEEEAVKAIRVSFSPAPKITRSDLSLAFDPLAIPDKTLLSASVSGSGLLDASVWDRTTKMLAVDVAPYVRGIVAYDHQLAQERLRLSNLLSEGGRPGKKRMRNTRSALSAMEGGSRSTTRRENYFKARLNTYIVLGTGGKWVGAIREQVALEAERLESQRVKKDDGLDACIGGEDEERLAVEGMIEKDG